MSAGSFEKTSIPWQVQQAVQAMQEWLELQLPDLDAIPSVPTIAPWILQTIFWLVAVCLTLWLTWQLSWLLRRYLQPADSPRRSLEGEIFQSPREISVAEWVRRAQNYQRRGDYAQACRALYLAMLQRLDDTRQLPHQLSRTDGEYLHLIQTLPHPQPYQVLISTHEQLCFRNASISPEVFQHCQTAYQEIEAQ